MCRSFYHQLPKRTMICFQVHHRYQMKTQNRSRTTVHEDVRRSQRPTKGIPPVRLIEEAYIIGNALEEEREPRSFNEAITCPSHTQWKAAMLDELKSHSDNGSRDAIRPEGSGLQMGV